MFYTFENGKIAAVADQNVILNEKHQYIGILNLEESPDLLQKFGISSNLLEDEYADSSMLFENHDDFDYMRVYIFENKHLMTGSDRIHIYMRNNLLLFICRNVEQITKLLPDFDDNKNLKFDRILINFFERLTAGDSGELEKTEQAIYDLEKDLFENKNRNCVNQIMSLRRQLMAYKRYYEQLLNLLDELLENENETLHSNAIRYFKIYTGKVGRLHQNILSLRDYLTQVREAYQAEVDIGLNNIMKTFTVITAIFLPLTLLVGWYGMNLQMPEFRWAYGYLMVIVLSIAIIAFCIIYFKKHKWY